MPDEERAAENTSLYGFKFREPDERRSDTRKTHDIKQLWQRSHEILSLAVLGHKQTDIAKMLNIHPQTVSNTLNSTLGKEATAEKREERDDEFKKLEDDVMELTKKSLKIYHEILDEEDESGRVGLPMKMKAADTIVLELSGLRAPTRIDSRNISYRATLEEIESFKKRGLEAARANGKIVVVKDEGKQSREAQSTVLPTIIDVTNTNNKEKESS